MCQESHKKYPETHKKCQESQKNKQEKCQKSQEKYSVEDIYDFNLLWKGMKLHDDKHEQFCHNANPAIIHPNQAEPNLPKWASSATYGSTFSESTFASISVHQHTYIPIASSDI